MLIDAMGSGLVLAASVLYFISYVGLTPAELALALSAAGVCGVLASVAVGPVIDALGARLVLSACYLVAAAGFVAYCLAASALAVAAAVCLVRVGLRAARPARDALLAEAVEPDERIATRSFVYGIQNAALGAGGLLAAAALATGWRGAYIVLFACNVASYVVAAGLIRTLTSTPTATPVADPAPASGGGWGVVLRDRPFVALASLDGVLGLQHNILPLALPLWVSLYAAGADAVAPAMLALNTVLVVALQARISAHRTTLISGLRAYRPGGYWLHVACTLFAVATLFAGAPAVAVLAAAVVGLTLGELYSGVGQWALALHAPPAELRGRYLGVASAARAAEDCVGPALVTYLVAEQGAAGWLVLGAAMLGAGLLCRRVGDRLAGARVQREARLAAAVG